MKKTVAFLATALLSLSMLFSGCGGGGDKKAEAPKADNAAKELTVYTARSESLNNAVIKNFEKRYRDQSECSGSRDRRSGKAGRFRKE